MANHKLPADLTYQTIGKVVTLEVFERKYTDSEEVEPERETYVGTLSNFYHNKDGMIFTISDFAYRIVTRWDKHIIVLTAH